MEGGDDGCYTPAGRRALARLLTDLQRLETIQTPAWPARERVASELGPEAARLIAALVPARSRPPRRRARIVGW